MRTVATYSLNRPAGRGAGLVDELEALSQMIEGWLREKGAGDVGIGQRDVTLVDGRVARFQRERIETDYGALDSFMLSEPTPSGHFETRLSLAGEDGETVLFCQLGTGTIQSAVAPLFFEARCPQAVRDIVRGGGWRLGASQASGDYETFLGREGGRRLRDRIWNENRGLPVVVVSEHQGFTLHPDLARDLSVDLTGLAVVAQIDEDASWILSELSGQTWSCFGGAIRLYWPFRATGNDPYSHPLWTRQRLLSGDLDSVTAAGRVQSRLRRMVFSQSAFRTAPALITKIREDFGAAQREHALEANDYRELADGYARDNSLLKQELADRDMQISSLLDEIVDLKAQNGELITSLQFAGGTASVTAEEYLSASLAVETVEDAVLQAMERFNGLVFGRDVDGGVAGLAPDAGPPMKILRYLERLNEMTAELETGTLGTTQHQWLRDRGVDVSGESRTDRNSPAHAAKRTWDDGSGMRRAFEGHLKPSDSTSPDRCVRIYFDYDAPIKKTIVGWVGRHPE